MLGIILWVVWKTLDDQLIPALDQFEKWGVKGIKVDFMQRSDQLLIDYYYKVSQECAKRKMLVDFHGDQKPATMTRTWPNLISTEGVRGMEWSKWSADVRTQAQCNAAIHSHVPRAHGLHARRHAERDQSNLRCHSRPAHGARYALPPTSDVCSFRESAANAFRQPVKLSARA